MKHISRCIVCKNYTMKEACCNQNTTTTKPARYSPDKYAKYRREARRNDLKERGLL